MPGAVCKWVAGKTHSRFLSVEKAEMVRRQIAAGQEFRSRTEAYWQVREQWADAELEQTEAAEALCKCCKPPKTIGRWRE